MRIRAVAALPANLDVEEVRRRAHGTGANGHESGRHPRHEVKAVDLVDARIVERARVDHRARAAEHFLGGLEEEHRGAGEVRAARRQELGEDDRDGGVTIVAARVHHAGGARAERQVELLGERQRVDVGAPGDRLARPVAAQDADDAGLRHPGAHVEPGLVEPFRDDLRGASLLERQLRMTMEVSPERDEIVVPALHVARPVDRWLRHACPLVSLTPA